MNVLFLSTENPFPPDHGHHIRTYHTLKLLAEENTIWFVGFAPNQQELVYRKELERLCAGVEIFLIPESAQRWRLLLSLFLNLFSRLPFVAQKYYSKQAAAKVRQIIASHRIDLVHFDMLPLARFRKVVDPLPKVLVNHNVESLRLWRWMQVERQPLLKAFLFYQFLKLRHFEKVTCPKFDRCVVTSDYDKDVLAKLCGFDNFVTIPNGVDTQFFSPNVHHAVKRYSLVWVGSMADVYNHDAVNYFIKKIWPLIYAHLPQTTITFVGHSPTPEILSAARENPNIRTQGYVEDIRPFVDAAEVFVAPLRSGSGTKIKVLNAMSQGKSVVTTTVGAEGIAATPNREIFIADNPRVFASQVVFLLNNPEVTKEVGLAARRAIERNYDWNILKEIIHRTNDEVYTRKGVHNARPQ